MDAWTDGLDPLTRRQLLKRLGTLGVAAAASGTLARSADAAGSLFATKPSTLRWVVTAAPSSLDIATTFTGDVSVIGQLVNEPLMVLDHNGGLAPWLAE